MPKVIKTSETPNPQALRFHLGAPLLESGSRDFPTVESAQSHPLARRLFEIPQVAAVFFLGSSVTVTKYEDFTWESLITPIADLLEEPAWESVSKPHSPPGMASEGEKRGVASSILTPQMEAYTALSREGQKTRIEALLNQHIRPGLQGDGGDLDLVDWDEQNVVVRYAGACGTCPTSTTGTLTFIEQILHEHLHPKVSVHLA
jgi:NFU1 iron-sulfur cluster scaffold homolog, mitochondrial